MLHKFFSWRPQDDVGNSIEEAFIPTGLCEYSFDDRNDGG